MGQLQDFLNECRRLGWKPRGIEVKEIYCTKEDLPIRLYQYIEDRDHSIHDLFSVESGIMEFVDRYEYSNKGDLYIPYEKMSMMNSEQKVKWFLDNAFVPR